MNNSRKRKWIKAITATILVWRNYLKTGDKKKCPLCITTVDGNKFGFNCNRCIHTTKYSQGIPCTNQKSFERIVLFDSSTPRSLPTQPKIGYVKWRISYLLKIKKKLIKDL